MPVHQADTSLIRGTGDKEFVLEVGNTSHMNKHAAQLWQSQLSGYLCSADR